MAIGSANARTRSPSALETDAAAGARPSLQAVEQFHALYRRHFDFVFRNLRRLGVAAADLDDAVQDVFMVVLRHIDKYQADSHGKAWLFAIALRIARNRRRGMLRKGGLTSLDEIEVSASEPSPFRNALSAQAAQVLRAFLASIDDDKRSVFVMTELEQMSAPEIASALQVNLNTVYARIRAARREFARLVEQHAQREHADGER
jgi:RNA polymerase sigma-70 factor (ECF subfamily)